MPEIMPILDCFEIELGLIGNSLLFESAECHLFVLVVVDVVPPERARCFPTCNGHDGVFA